MPEDENNKKEDLLNSFLSQVTPWRSNFSEESSLPSSVDISSLTLADYPVVPVPTQLEIRIQELQGITQSIESKALDSTLEIQKLDFSKYKVNYALALNPAQLAAVAITERPLLVIAGAGSGKTRVIVHRVAYLIEKGIDPRSILLLTFTRKASKEMLDRVETLLHEKEVSKVTGGTFHSFASHVLRKYANMIGLPHNFTIIDSADSEDIIDLIRTELKFNTQAQKFPRKDRIYEIISYSRNKRSTIADIVHEQYSGLEDYIADLEIIFSGYTRYKKASMVLDFDDLMEVLHTSLSQNQRFREALQNSFEYVMVDEFQDTNATQNEIVQMIAGKHRRIMVVGDDSQSIYAFRGADYENILRFPKVYPDCAVIKIEENYRSNQNILDFTNSIVGSAKIGYKKLLFTRHLNTNIPVIKKLYDQQLEAEFIVNRVMDLSETGIKLNEIAILNRADWHNRYIQAELTKRGIPYVVVGGFKFNERMHIRDMIAFLKLTYNPKDALSWHRVLKYIGGIGQVTASSIISSIQESSDQFAFENFNKKKFFNDLQQLGRILSKASLPEISLTEKLQMIKEFYAPILKSREIDYLHRMQDVEVLIDLSRKYREMDRFLSDFALDPPSKRVADQTTPLIDEGEEDGKVTVSTIHSAKGREWYAVFIPHALEGLIPSNRARNIEEMEEERRLFYVACSRAKEELYITFPQRIISYDALFHLPSRFILEIDKSKYLFARD